MPVASLFAPTTLGPLELKNHLVMAPMTRSRAVEANTPNALMAEFYGQRATAGLIVTEGTSPSPNGTGYPRIPGIWSAAQVAGWRLVTDAVHSRGGRIFVQLMHTGRVGHPLNLPAGAELLAPSAVAAPGEMYTDAKGLQPHPVPRAMTDAEVRHAVQEHVAAAHNALAAGFDGVELHGANGYLLEQFLSPDTNRRSDAWGGPPAARSSGEPIDAAAATNCASSARSPSHFANMLPPSEMPTACRAAVGPARVHAPQDPVALLGVAGVIGARKQVGFAGAAAEVHNQCAPAAIGRRLHEHARIVAARIAFQSVKQHEQRRRRVGGFGKREVDVDEVAVGCVPALAPVADARQRHQLGREDRLQVPARQPGRRGVALVASSAQCRIACGSDVLTTSPPLACDAWCSTIFQPAVVLT